MILNKLTTNNNNLTGKYSFNKKWIAMNLKTNDTVKENIVLYRFLCLILNSVNIMIYINIECKCKLIQLFYKIFWHY